MTTLNKHTELRKELSNPSIGSNHHLRKLALSLLDELEVSESKCSELASKAMELVCEASLVYSKYNDTQMPDRDLVDMQTLQEMHDLCKGAAL
ncbi:hypothetical protein [Citrobacter werkmanii]|uniref:hypothetical protein n=1 Tax=Citrobacter werkmanii TaxID=67827 RepID=UPI001575A237|nr:hypothetical protein [Citrobacter werkmanii]NTY83116.1 hypothetical protein [Citrobacter werkmanii]HCJ7769757.1 hypothetical protein [Citrobacter freundii]